MKLTQKQQDAMLAAGVIPPKDGETVIVGGEDNMADFETISGTDLEEQCVNEAFMNEWVGIRLAQTTDKNQPPFATVTCVGQGITSRLRIPRGIKCYVKRSQVEILARMRETSYTQPPMNLSDPESANYLIPSHALSYPFEVIEDKNPIGHEWLRRILDEPTF